ncbi:MAG: MFS transporter [Pseudomonadota bacterium]
MVGLVVAGEAVYLLPFVVARFFRPTLLETFGLSNTELGTAMAVYGVVAMLSYFPGGPLADRFSARKLLALSLWTTAAGGMVMATLPGFRLSVWVWGFFGVTTILLFWAALIRATRDWGGAESQGRAFGLLDAGRGVLAAVMASLGAALFAWSFPDGYQAASFDERRQVMTLIIHGYTLATFLAGIFVWFAVPERPPGRGKRWDPAEEPVFQHVGRALKLPAVWLTGLIVVCAYVAYKGFDNYGLYAVQAFGIDEVEAARLTAIGAWVRPVAALAFGLLGDRFLVSRMTALCFALLVISQGLFAVLTPEPTLVWVLWLNVLIGSAAIFGLRALYYALLEEARVPKAITGTAVGIISVVGYSPDIFVNYLGGVMLDAAPGLAGHQDYFTFLAAFAALGLMAAIAMMLLLKHQRGGVPAPNL